MTETKKLSIDKNTLSSIFEWVDPTKDWIDKKFASCQSLFPIINIMGYEIVVELGTHWGSATASLVDNCPSIEKIYTIDSYLPYKDTVPPYIEVNDYDCDFLKQVAKRNFSYLPEHLQEKINVIYGDTMELSSNFDDDSIDFIWFDAHLTKEQLNKELELWYPKLKYGGLAGVHDCGNNGSGMNKVVYNFLEDKPINGNISYFNDTLSWIKDEKV